VVMFCGAHDAQVRSYCNITSTTLHRILPPQGRKEGVRGVLVRLEVKE